MDTDNPEQRAACQHDAAIVDVRGKLRWSALERRAQSETAVRPRHPPSAKIVPQMPDLATKACVPCRGGVPPLKGEELASLQKQVGGWNVIEEHHLTKAFKFPDFREAFKFVNRVGELAEEQGHHPDIFLAWG